MLLTCSSNFKLLQNVTPSCLADTTRSIPVKHDGKDERADGLQKNYFFSLHKIDNHVIIFSPATKVLKVY